MPPGSCAVAAQPQAIPPTPMGPVVQQLLDGPGLEDRPARVPHAVDDVELAGATLVPEPHPGPLQLVLGVQAGLAHGLLVERHEAYSVDPAGHREVERLPEPLQHRGPGRDRDPAARHLGGVHGGQVEKVRNPAGVVGVRDGGDLPNWRLEPGHLATGPEHPRVRDNEDVGPLPHLGEVEQPGHQLRPDARRIALHERDRGLHGHACIRSGVSGASCAFMQFHLQRRSSKGLGVCRIYRGAGW